MADSQTQIAAELTDASVWHPNLLHSWVLAAKLSLWNIEGGFNESFNSFLTSAVIELNSHRRAGSSAHHKPFPPIRDGGSVAAGMKAAQSI